MASHEGRCVDPGSVKVLFYGKLEAQGGSGSKESLSQQPDSCICVYVYTYILPCTNTCMYIYTYT